MLDQISAGASPGAKGYFLDGDQRPVLNTESTRVVVCCDLGHRYIIGSGSDRMFVPQSLDSQAKEKMEKMQAQKRVAISAMARAPAGWTVKYDVDQARACYHNAASVETFWTVAEAIAADRKRVRRLPSSPRRS